MNSSRDLKFFVMREIKENFKTPYDFAQTFKVDYQNVCKWYRNYENLPIKYAFEFADYLNMKLVVFRDRP